MVWMKPSPGKRWVLIVALLNEINPSWFSLLLVKIKYPISQILQYTVVHYHSAWLTAPLTDDFCVLQNANPLVSDYKERGKERTISRETIQSMRDNLIAKLSTVLNLLCVCVSSCALDSYGSFPGKVECQCQLLQALL